ncbi:hypothetical protein P3T76_007589 [Phytophthora citrophthora]|uniref:Uncharacterized protein n=1 Tax=Phytophthora citrophthora TaxID=4793 RepID=A0AAD9LL73_9STRA|nr:hypothetical protein P3T76_007589 [Phytophthora citrophthora]
MNGRKKISVVEFRARTYSGALSVWNLDRFKGFCDFMRLLRIHNEETYQYQGDKIVFAAGLAVRVNAP